jgi:hypothetical protein
VGDRHEVGERLERRHLEQRRPDRHHGAGRDRERVTVRLSFGDGLAGDDTGAARLVLDDDRLAQRLRQLLAVDAHQRVHAGAGGQRHDDGDGAGRIVLRLRRQNGNAGEQRGRERKRAATRQRTKRAATRE